ncbi:hypothetical protein VMCG_00079 [Cytospora schulzeri]|uniref:Clr5 domain-containing protein n=1 Tax=Cytospora schulzeri TaxID=448051 RepID=A0A423X958_9PEZI|nr:hypothetical protein VMCG_00079 [Valsa malicola]
MDSQLVNIKVVPEGMMGTNAQKTRWASPSDWESQKQRILHLYKYQDHPLWKVMQTMRDDYGFLATQKMYKYHLRRWGIRKNLQAAQVQEFVQEGRLGDEATSTLSVGGVRVNRKRLERHLKRVRQSGDSRAGGPDNSQLQLPSHAARRRTPSPERMLQNSFQPEVEKILHAVRSYVGGSFDAGRWSKSHIPWEKDLFVAAHNSAWTAGRLMNSGHIPQAFHMLNLCLDSCGKLLAAESPLFPLGMYAELFEFSKRNEALTRSIISFLRQLALVTYQSRLHPIYALFDTMSRMTSKQLCECAWTLGVTYCGSLSEELGDSSNEGTELSLYGHCFSWLAAYAPVEDTTAEGALQMHTRCLSVGGKTTFEVLEAKLRLANFFLDRQRYSEARSAAEEVISLDQGGAAGAKNAYLIDDCHRILFWVSRVDSSQEETVRAASRWVNYCTTQLGKSHELTVDALGEVAEYFRDVGDKEAASKACRDHDIAIDDMCERLGRIGLEADGCGTQKRTMLYGRMSQRGSSVTY